MYLAMNAAHGGQLDPLVDSQRECEALRQRCRQLEAAVVNPRPESFNPPAWGEEEDEECAHAPGSPTGRQGTDLMAAKQARQQHSPAPPNDNSGGYDSRQRYNTGLRNNHDVLGMEGYGLLGTPVQRRMVRDWMSEDEADTPDNAAASEPPPPASLPSRYMPAPSRLSETAVERVEAAVASMERDMGKFRSQIEVATRALQLEVKNIKIEIRHEASMQGRRGGSGGGRDLLAGKEEPDECEKARRRVSTGLLQTVENKAANRRAVSAHFLGDTEPLSANGAARVEILRGVEVRAANSHVRSEVLRDVEERAATPENSRERVVTVTKATAPTVAKVGGMKKSGEGTAKKKKRVGGLRFAAPEGLVEVIGIIHSLLPYMDV